MPLVCSTNGFPEKKGTGEYLDRTRLIAANDAASSLDSGFAVAEGSSSSNAVSSENVINKNQ